MAGGIGAAMPSSENEPANKRAKHNVKRFFLIAGFLRKNRISRNLSKQFPNGKQNCAAGVMSRERLNSQDDRSLVQD
jgi:hypothetical protein